MSATLPGEAPDLISRLADASWPVHPAAATGYQFILNVLRVWLVPSEVSVKR
jgi:hypothetical protein